MRNKVQWLVVALVVGSVVASAWAAPPMGRGAGMSPRMGGGKGMAMKAPELPEPLFKRSDAAFAKGDRKAAAQDMQKAAAVLRTWATRFPKEDKANVDASAAEIDKLAKNISKADNKQLRMTFAGADLAIGRYHQRLASQAWAKKDSRVTGMNLMGAAMQVQNGATWMGFKATPQQISDTRSAGMLGQKMARGEKANPAEVDKAMKLIGSEIGGLGQMLGRRRK